VSIYAPGSFSGNYVSQGDPSDADCVIGHEFAFRKNGFGRVNEQLADFIAKRYVRTDLPLFLNRNIAGALNEIEPDVEPAAVFTGESSNLTATHGEGTWGELRQAKALMDANSLERPILVAQAYHVGRVALQAIKQGIEPIVPEGLPSDFDPESEQIWPRNQLLWGVHELLGVPVLHKRNQI
jgi:hypothetical protein